MGITKRGLAVLALGVPAAFLGAVVFPPYFPVAAFVSLYLLVFGIDFALAASKRTIRARIAPLERLEQGREGGIAVSLQNTGKQTVSICARLPLPASIADLTGPFSARIAPGGDVAETVRITPAIRGDYPAAPLAIECVGPLGLALRRSSVRLDATYSVYSDLAPYRSARLLARKKLLDRESAASHRMRGLGTDFSEIREYAPGDDYRKINWKATASTGKLHTNVYDVEKDLSVIAAVDTGRLMLSPAGEKSRLDYAIESALALISAALHSGDRAGFLVFGHDIKHYIPPGRDRTQTGRILDASYGLRPEYYESDLRGLSAFVLKKQKRRSLVVVFTYLSDSEQAKRIRTELAPLARRHALLVCSLQNPALADLACLDVADSGALYARASALFRLEGQRAAASVLRGGGIYGFSAEPDKLPIGTVNRYLEQKKRIRF
ncbi:DUF58 domain-containing protein [Oscillospiraceae bacterium OttesenSCG-928-G22]|nr:DUF58 domain-containing protein [Oscillospiraceae bacterium OttesenSCG-928-G22]